MKKIKCFQCGAMLKGTDAYHAHRAEHKSGKIKAKIPNRPDSIGSMAMPDELKGELLPKKKPVKQELKPTVVEKKPTKDTRIPTKVKSEAPKLEYKYSGNCTHCGKPVETLELDDLVPDKTKIMVVAWCLEHKKIRQRLTNKL